MKKLRLYASIFSVLSIILFVSPLIATPFLNFDELFLIIPLKASVALGVLALLLALAHIINKVRNRRKLNKRDYLVTLFYALVAYSLLSVSQLLTQPFCCVEPTL